MMWCAGAIELYFNVSPHGNSWETLLELIAWFRNTTLSTFLPYTAGLCLPTLILLHIINTEAVVKSPVTTFPGPDRHSEATERRQIS